MKLSVSVKPNSKKPGIEIVNETEWIVKVREPALEGKANEAVLFAIAKKLELPPKKVILLKGEKSKKKLVEILT